MSDRVYSADEVLALARQAYRTGQASFDVVAERCALLVIDMQDEFVKPGWTPYWVPEATRMVPRVATVIARCREVGVPVIYTAFAATHQRLDRPRSGAFMPNRYPAAGDSAAWFRDGRIWHELAPRPEDVVIFKPSYGAFYDTPLEPILRNVDRDTVIVAGTLTNFCCGTTARQGYERGFHVVFGSDITATDDPDMQEVELRVLRKGFARVLTAEEIVSALHAGMARQVPGPAA
jgi:nicotinamidase-related amidase